MRLHDESFWLLGFCKHHSLFPYTQQCVNQTACILCFPHKDLRSQISQKSKFVVQIKMKIQTLPAKAFSADWVESCLLLPFFYICMFVWMWRFLDFRFYVGYYILAVYVPLQKANSLKLIDCIFTSKQIQGVPNVWTHRQNFSTFYFIEVLITPLMSFPPCRA